MDRMQLSSAFGAQECSSPAMQRAVDKWFSLYYGGGLLRLPYTIVRKLVRGVFAEYSLSGGFGAEILRGLPHARALEYALIGGESYLAPQQTGGAWQWRVIPRSSILVFGRGCDGEPTDVGLTETFSEGRFCFTLLERRRVDRQGVLTVTNRLFRSASRGELGREVSLRACDRYAALPERYVYPQPIGSVGLVRLAMPMANTVDGSGEGVSVYAPAVELMEALEENEQQLRREFRNGASRLVVSRDMLRDGQLRDDLFVGLDESPESVGITVFSPELREGSYLARQQAYLRSLENLIGLKRGLLSQVEAVDRTATEVTSSEGEYMTTLLDLQKTFQQAAFACVALVERLAGRAAGDVQIHWGDGVV